MNYRTEEELKKRVDRIVKKKRYSKYLLCGDYYSCFTRFFKEHNKIVLMVCKDILKSSAHVCPLEDICGNIKYALYNEPDNYDFYIVDKENLTVTETDPTHLKKIREQNKN